MSEKEEFEKLPVGMPKWMREHLELYLSDPDKAYLWDSTIGGGPGPLPTLLLIARGAVESEGKEDDGGQTIDVGALFRPRRRVKLGADLKPRRSPDRSTPPAVSSDHPFITTKGVPRRRWSFRPVVSRREKLRRFGAVRVDFRELQGVCGVSVGEPPVVPSKCNISG